MIIFSLVAAIMVILAVAFLLPSVFKPKLHDQTDRQALNIEIARQRQAELKAELSRGEMSEEDYAIAARDLESTLATDLDKAKAVAKNEADKANRGRWAGVLIALITPLLAVGLYLQLGSPQSIEAKQSDGLHANTDGQPMPSIDELISRLEGRLQSEPEDAEGWFMLARTYMAMNRYDDAITALKKVQNLIGDEPAVLVRIADAVAMKNDGTLTEEARTYLQRALVLDPANVQGLWLMGIAEAEQGKFPEAIDYWNKAMPLLADEPQSQAELRQLITAAEQQINNGQTPATPDVTADANQAEAQTGQQTNDQATTAPVQAAQPQTAATTPARLTVSVSLDASVAGQVAENDTVFIFAKALSGPPMPLAAVKKSVKDLPVTIVLDDSTAMMPRMALSQFSEVRVEARVSKSGQALPQSGDWEGQVSPVTVGQEAVVNVVITQQIP